jgi:hypothetical protein
MRNDVSTFYARRHTQTPDIKYGLLSCETLKYFYVLSSTDLIKIIFKFILEGKSKVKFAL